MSMEFVPLFYVAYGHRVDQRKRDIFWFTNMAGFEKKQTNVFFVNMFLAACFIIVLCTIIGLCKWQA